MSEKYDVAMSPVAPSDTAPNDDPPVEDKFPLRWCWVLLGGVTTGCGVVALIIGMLLLVAQRRLSCPLLVGVGAGAIVLSLATVATGATIIAVSMRCSPRPCRRIPCLAGAVVGFVFLAGLLAALSAVGAAFFIMSLNVSSYTIDHNGAPGLSADVSITRDAFAVPHVTAATRHDAVFAQGFIHAQDRLAQMELLRIAGKGELSKYVGSAGVDTDKAVRSAGFPDAAARMCREADAQTRSLLDRYVAGVNYFLKTDGSRPPEFMFIGVLLVFHEPEAFAVEDLCRIFKLLQWDISRNVDLEMNRWELWHKTGQSFQDIDALYPHRKLPNYTILSRQDMGVTAADEAAADVREAEDARLEEQLYADVMSRFKSRSKAAASTVPQREAGHRFAGVPLLAHGLAGSNAWASRSPGQAPVLASDPHLAAQLPNPWHPIHARWGARGEFFVAGVTMPGVPSVLIGRNNAVAFGVTMAQTDLGDLFVMQPDPARPDTHYIHNGVSRAYTIRRERIQVRGKSDVTLDVKVSHYGPDISEGWELSTGSVVCLASAVTDTDNSTIAAFMSATNPEIVKSVTAFRNALREVQSPALSLATADINGGIGYVVTGRHPKRARGHTGRYPTWGNGTFDYVGVVAQSALPSKVDTDASAAGWIGAANQQIYPQGYPHTLSYDWSPSLRSRVLHRALAATPDALLSDVPTAQRLQMDVNSSLWGFDLRPLMANTTAGSWGARFEAGLDDAGRAMRTEMMRWDAVAAVGTWQPTALWRWITRITHRVPREAGAVLENHFWYPREYGVFVVLSPTDVHDGACRRAMGAATGGCMELAVAEWNSVAVERSSLPLWGSDDANRLHGRHFLFDGTFLSCMGNRDIAHAGDRSSLNVADEAGKETSDKMTTSWVASTRHIFDLGENASYLFAIPGGVSGNPFSKHYDDLLAPWEDGHVTVQLADFSGKTQKLKP